jgi:hypothetical protein
MSEKLVINPQLIEALDHYADGSYNPTQPSFCVLVDANGRQTRWPLEKTCNLAAKVLANEELAYLKLKALQEGMKRHGADRLYTAIMGEPLP